MDEWATKQILGTLAGVVGLTLLGGLGFIYSGLFNVAADKNHSSFKIWMLRTVTENSVVARADSVDEPPDLNSRDLLLTGASHYDSMCTGCHGAPGKDPGGIGKSLHPQPPNLAKGEGMFESPRAQFWVSKHGIDSTGMPAWGTTHEDRSLWAMVALIQKFEDMTPEKYRKLVREAKKGGHHHGGGGDHHDSGKGSGHHEDKGGGGDHSGKDDGHARGEGEGHHGESGSDQETGQDHDTESSDAGDTGPPEKGSHGGHEHGGHEGHNHEH
jgi:mono/diheme cytochrome c family protein